MKLPKELITVTPLSKLVALILFIALPIIAFIFGMNYQKKMYKPVNRNVMQGNLEEYNISP